MLVNPWLAWLTSNRPLEMDKVLKLFAPPERIVQCYCDLNGHTLGRQLQAQTLEPSYRTLLKNRKPSGEKNHYKSRQNAVRLCSERENMQPVQSARKTHNWCQTREKNATGAKRGKMRLRNGFAIA